MLWRIVLWTTGVVFVTFVVAVSVFPAFHGYSPRKADKDAMIALKDTLTRAAASMETQRNSDRETSAADLVKNGSNSKSKARPEVLIRVCTGIRQNVTIPAYGTIRPSFELSCLQGVITHIAITETGIYAAVAHLEGSCIFVGNSLEGGVQRSNPECRIEVPDWTGALPDGIVERRLASHLAQVRSR